MIVAPGNRPRSDAAAPVTPVAFVATMPRSNSGSSLGSATAVTRGEVAGRPLLQAVLVQRLRVIVPPREHRDVRHLRQMRGEQASDRTGTDDADLHANL